MLMDGVVLQDELKTAMRLLGVERIEELGMQHVSDKELIY